MASILVVDDSVFLRRRIKDALKDDGYTIQEAGSGRLALDAIGQQEFNCILTDLVMPELDGFGLLEELRKREIHTPVVVLTADIQKTTRARCEELGALALLTKPVDRTELRAAVARALQES